MFLTSKTQNARPPAYAAGPGVRSVRTHEVSSSGHGWGMTADPEEPTTDQPTAEPIPDPDEQQENAGTSLDQPSEGSS